VRSEYKPAELGTYVHQKISRRLAAEVRIESRKLN